jgi:ribosomal protein S14
MGFKGLKLRDRLSRLALSQSEIKTRALKLVIKQETLIYKLKASLELQKLTRYSSISNLTSRCIESGNSRLTKGRSRKIHSEFKLSPIVLRNKVLSVVILGNTASMTVGNTDINSNNTDC